MNVSTSADLAAAPPIPVTSVAPGIERIRSGFLLTFVGALAFSLAPPATRLAWILFVASAARVRLSWRPGRATSGR